MSLLKFNNLSSTQAAPASGKSRLYAKTDRNLYYIDENGLERLIDSETFITMQGGTFTLTSQTAAQKLFNNPTNGQLTVPGLSSWEFECSFDLSSMSSSSGAFGFAIAGSATFTFSEWESIANKATLATAATPFYTKNKNSLANTALVSANTNTTAAAYIRGLLRVNAGGTIIPQVSLGVAAAAIVGQDSWFRAWMVGSNTVVSSGPWS